MSRRATFEIYSIAEVDDNFGGYTEELTLEQTLHGSIASTLIETQTNESGTVFETVHWFRSYKKVTEPSQKKWFMDGIEYRVKTAHQQKRRWFYQLEQVAGGEWYANQD